MNIHEFKVDQNKPRLQIPALTVLRIPSKLIRSPHLYPITPSKLTRAQNLHPIAFFKLIKAHHFTPLLPLRLFSRWYGC